MHRFLAVIILAASFALAGSGLAPAAYHAHHGAGTHRAVHHVKVTKILRIAPADEYFGRLKMSILGIGNQLRDLDLRLKYTPEKSADVLGAASFVEDAMHDWEHKYPGDPWLAKDIFKLTRLYEHVHTDDGHRRAENAAHWLAARYGKTWYARQARKEIASSMK